jgi:hypothetical protein
MLKKSMEEIKMFIPSNKEEEDDLIMTDNLDNYHNSKTKLIDDEFSRNNRNTIKNALIVAGDQSPNNEEIRSRNNFIPSFSISS